MILPPANTLALAESNDELAVDAGVMPAPDAEAVLALLPSWVADEADVAVRDAFVAAWGAMANALWACIGQTLARTASPRFAAGPWLALWGAALKQPRAHDETEGAYRERLLLPFLAVTPNAIRGAVDALVADVTPEKAACFEMAVDQGYWCDDDPAATWGSFWQGDTTRLLADGAAFPMSAGGCYWSDSDNNLPEFWVVLPGDADDDSDAPYATETADAVDPDAWGEDAPVWPETEDRYFPAHGDGLDDRIIADVEARRAYGVCWFMLVDPFLGDAR